MKTLQLSAVTPARPRRLHRRAERSSIVILPARSPSVTALSLIDARGTHETQRATHKIAAVV
jgi:hypothetical protein